MSDEEAKRLNEEMAKVMGWEQWPTGAWNIPGKKFILNLPDFCRDNQAAGYLLDYLNEIGIEMTVQTIRKGLDYKAQGHPGYRHRASKWIEWHYGRFPGEAIVRALLAGSQSSCSQSSYGAKEGDTDAP